MSSAVNRARVTPASLTFLAIYNPSLGNDDESLQDQIVYYYSSRDNGQTRPSSSSDSSTEQSREDLNERLRQIGLAQGMIEFARGSSNGSPIDAIETEKSRIILHELEPGWWILASIGLTRISSTAEKPLSNPSSSKSGSTVEYSTREVSPPALLLQQLLRAHQVFLLHHALSLSSLYSRLVRPKFCRFLRHFWDNYIWDWDVLLNGNPAVDLFNGLKLAAGGELGIGVGEEDWGSGEREVLEGFIGRTEGLVDLVVSRFGDAPTVEPEPRPKDKFEWQGNGSRPRPSDGVIFSGIGAVTRHSVKAVSSWVEVLYKHGQEAYGIRYKVSAPRHLRHSNKSHGVEKRAENPLNGHSPRPNESSKSKSQSQPPPVGIPPPIVGSVRLPATVSKKSESNYEGNGTKANTGAIAMAEDRSSGTATLMKYLTLGVYGSKGETASETPIDHRRVSYLRDENLGDHDAESRNSSNASNIRRERRISHGYFMIGLQGDLDPDNSIEDDDQDTEPSAGRESFGEIESWSRRTMLRTIYVERTKKNAAESSVSMRTSSVGDNSSVAYDAARLRVVVYVQQPFIFTFLFELQTNSLALPSFYLSLHHQLGPLQRPLISSTCPIKVAKRLREAASPRSTSATSRTQSICDLVYDPVNLTVHTNIPNIPDPVPYSLGSTPPDPATSWSRVEALSVHSQILNTHASTRRNMLEQERTCKTSRDWWVVWMRLPYQIDNKIDNKSNDNLGSLQSTSSRNINYREAYLIRKASDYVSASSSSAGKSGGADSFFQLGGNYKRFSLGLGRGGKTASGSNDNSKNGAGEWMNSGRLTEGIGIDARRYIEDLLSLNR